MSKIHPDLKNSFYQRILTRRNSISDILLFLKKETEDIPFYFDPEDFEIVSLYYKFVFHLNNLKSKHLKK